MKKRWGYLLTFGLLLAVEVCIGLFVRDRFIRPYVGDLLVTVLLCCLCRVILPKLNPALPVFLLAALVEGLQWLELTQMLGLQGTVLGIILGTTFDWKDLVCYGLGCLVFWAVERLLKHRHAKSSLR